MSAQVNRGKCSMSARGPRISCLTLQMRKVPGGALYWPLEQPHMANTLRGPEW